MIYLIIIKLIYIVLIGYLIYINLRNYRLSQGRFFIPINTLTSTKFSSPVSLLIKDSSGSTLKTIRSPGS